MVSMRVAGLLLVGLMVMTVLPAQAQQAFEQCGDIQLVFRNPDLQRQSDGNVHASGSFFAQFQAIGEAADQITFFGFSFGPVQSPITEDSGVCDLPPGTWTTGAYILNYRADTNPDDGFFINLQTPLVPDGTYAAAVHAYDAQNNELARAWTNAIVNNCDPAPVPVERCDGDTAQNTNNDVTAPWPIILPGDGDLAAAPDTPDGATLTLEFAEPLAGLHFFVDGVEVTGNLTAWPGRLWDDDLLPGYGPVGLGAILVPECSQQPPQECTTLGEAYYYTGTITDDSVVRVEAFDAAGNLAKKEIHIGSGAAGAITDDLPNLQITVDELSKTVGAGEADVFQFTLTNTGGTTAHPFASATGPEGWELTWTPPHQPTQPGETEVQELGVRVPADTPPGIYTLNATIEYKKANQDQSQTWELRVNVGGVAPDQQPAAMGEEAPKEAGKDSPAAAFPMLLVGLAAVALRRRSRTQ